MNKDKIQELPFYARLAFTLISVVLILFLLKEGKGILIPLFFALLASLLLYPVTRRLEKLHIGKGLASILSVLLFLLCIGGFIFFFSLQIIGFSKDIPILETKIQELLQHVQQTISWRYHIDSTQQMEYLTKSANSFLSGAANSIGNIFLNVIGIVIWTVFMFIYTYFMLYHKGLLVRFSLALFRPHHRAKVYNVLTQTRAVINSYVMGLLIEMATVAILNTAGFLILGIKYAVLLGLLTAVLNIIPYLGIYTGMAICALLTFANGTPLQALEVVIMLVFIHFLDANILLPRIVGAKVNMNPFITIVVVLIGHAIWGIPGMFLFIPLTAMIKIICEQVDALKPWAILIGTEEKITNKSDLPDGKSQLEEEGKA
ncbi:AI-2E family transporter [Taibaiella soli]|uniref:AI-2E family transporter n=1 Tax=Taibaiella soli TaxID=1649169 RepID=A0A2W2AEY7_9BACT|nr:AI-2E family transporter [Taibaiella soli]PZF72122.1 AI-2E family transporter [Taibaiella soli]